MEYPKEAIRGIRNFECLCNDRSFANVQLFQFQTENKRKDGWIEESINWRDDEDAIDFTLNQKNDEDELEFKVGIAIIERSDLAKLKKRMGILSFRYDRDKKDNNIYHGNVLIHGDIEKRIKHKIRSVLALYANVILRD